MAKNMLRFCLSLFVWMLSSANAAPVVAEHTTVELLAENRAIVPGESFDVAVRFKLEPHWHIYWENPGASGLAASIDWTLPEGITAGEIQWPAPERISMAGMVNYGYEEEAVLLVTMQASETLPLGATLDLQADLFWLICKEVCLPGDARLQLQMPVAEVTEAGEEAVSFQTARERQAQAQAPWQVHASLSDASLILSLSGSEMPTELYFYAAVEGQVDPSAEQTLSFPAANQAELHLPLDTPFLENQPDSISGILQSDQGAWQVTAEIGAAPTALLPADDAVASAAPRGFEQRLLALGLPGFLALAFLGGLILNIMPCVLPVLSLKVFSLLKHAGQARRDALRHGLAYTVGVVLSFLVLAGVLFALRALGERIGWGFQLQSPGFVVVLTTVFFLFGLNLMGVFELGGKLVGADASVAQRNDALGSFGMGILAAVVGAPCMGPLVAGVSGLAVQANLATGLLIFGMMGLGLASPFLVLSVFPKLVAFLPKPGLWMESFKQGMGFLLMGAVVFLALVAGRQGGVDAIFILLVIMLVSSVAAWIFGRWGAAFRSQRTQWIAKSLALALVGAALVIGMRAIQRAYTNYGEQPTLADATGQWGPWSADKVDALLAQGRPVFVDFTATWCLICQVNKKVALRTDATAELFQAYDIVALEADWTRYDPVITDALESFGRSGVPLYVLYTPDGEVTVLPQSLSNGIVRTAVEQAL
ncbi:protein-disulfide reductase DsbD family protein [Coraliomargarita sp. SDUM461004]|uniref:Protein-disulfide reductase DsbD family protein n=1 Tax=Thalassobacterium sedimentorum TaxID=3041258 RepID=A0ABU1AJX1_9BACT|nr:protein-disulfide reductase DsbD domain-containing protein [Coraliomargarita sp. SDUM461004]MDQ8194463.1 protein-disulfide reductase DsbD family protein [Coraliomargarita sp. SDUM461004]